MKKQFTKFAFAAGLAVLAMGAQAQNNVGVGTNTPDGSAILDVSSTTKGLLPPRMTTAQRDAMAASPNPPAVGLIIFNTDTKQLEINTGTTSIPAWTAGSGTASATASNGLGVLNGNVVLGGALTGATTVSGITPTNTLTFSGTQPSLFTNSTPWISGQFQSTYAGTTPDNVVLGTLNGVATLGAHNNALTSWANLSINTGGGNVGIGTAAPTTKLHVAGTFRVVDGSQGAGKVLTSDANGNATWGTLGTGTYSATASNGLTLSANDIKLGGALTGATTVSGITSTNTLSFSGTQPTLFTNSLPWIGGQFQSTSNSATPDKVVLGTLNGVATIAAHNNALSNWANLSINTGGGNVGIGTAAPTTKLHVAGTLRVVDGSQGAGKVLTSDANGNATWTTQSGESSTASNGLTLNGANITFGGALTGATTVSGITSTNTLSFSGTQPTLFTNSLPWIGGQFQSTSNSATPDKVVLGTLNGVATIAAHNNALSGWANLSINTGGGNVGIGTAAPTTKLHVAGTLRVVDGSQGTGKVLTSDANGNATWGTLAAGTYSATASNGLTLSGTNTALGGTLSGATTITGSDANTLTVSNTSTPLSTGNNALILSSPISAAGNGPALAFTNSVNGGIQARIRANYNGSTTGLSFLVNGGNTEVVSIKGDGSTTTIANVTAASTSGNDVVALASEVSSAGHGPALSFVNSVLGTTQARIRAKFNGSTTGLSFLVNGGNTEAMLINGNGSVLLSNLAGTGTRYVYADISGNLSATAGIPSDRRLKANVLGLNNAIERVMSLNPVTYDWKDKSMMGKHKQMGFIAQEMEKVVPEVVYVEEGKHFGLNNLHTIKYEQLTALLTKAIQEQQEEIEQLKAQNAKLTARIGEVAELKTAMAEMRRELSKVVVNKVAKGKVAKN